MTEAEIRADERQKCAAQIRTLNAEKTGHEWVRFSIWDKAMHLAASVLEGKTITEAEQKFNSDRGKSLGSKAKGNAHV